MKNIQIHNLASLRKSAINRQVNVKNARGEKKRFSPMFVTSHNTKRPNTQRHITLCSKTHCDNTIALHITLKR